jgi:hypothetical protein
MNDMFICTYVHMYLCIMVYIELWACMYLHMFPKSTESDIHCIYIYIHTYICIHIGNVFPLSKHRKLPRNNKDGQYICNETNYACLPACMPACLPACVCPFKQHHYCLEKTTRKHHVHYPFLHVHEYLCIQTYMHIYIL